ncbi:MAG: hypothetical protein P8H45_01225 [Flavobacteriaceae bacterium]|nr:hypothetical protein [Flavobacteriaceae bacterium]
MKTQISNTFFLLPLFAILFLINSCGSFSPVGYYNDGIYGDTPPPKKRYTKNTDGKYYKKYFGDKAKELVDNNRDVEIDSLSTPSQSNRDINNININVYGYESHGFYHDYNYQWNNYYYRPWVRHHRYRPWYSWSYYYEPYYYGWSHYSPYYAYYPHSYYGFNPYYHYYGSSYYTNPKQYVASSGRRGTPARGASNMRSNSTNSLSGDSYQIQRHSPNGSISTVNYNVSRRTSSSAPTSTAKESEQNNASNFMTRDYSNKRNYRSSSNRNNVSGSNNSDQSRQTRSSNNNYNTSRSSNRSYSSGSSSSSRSSSGSSSRSSSSGRR